MLQLYDTNARTSLTAFPFATVYGLLYSLSLSFPILTWFAPTYPSEHVEKFKEFVEFALSERRKSTCKSSQGDFLDHLNVLLEKIGKEEFKNLGITEVTVYAQAMILFIVSYEQFTSCLVFLFYFLAKHPEQQEKLFEEIDKCFETNNGSVDFQSMPELPSLSACIQETLRLVPNQRRMERICVKDYEYQGLKIPKGMTVMVPLFPCHRNPEYFEKPEKFMPERFMRENGSNLVPYSCNIFGNGPRSCAGQRYSMEVLRYSAAHILLKFKFQIRSDTEVVFKPGRLLMVQYNPVILDVVKRQKY